MNEAWQRAGLADFRRHAGLTDFEEYFLQSILRLADTSGVLADNASAVRTVAFTVPWASSLYTAYQAGQIWQSHLHKALLSASAACEYLQVDRLNLPTARNWRAILSTYLSVPSASAAPLIIGPQDVERHQLEVASLVLSGSGQPSSLTFDQLNLLAAEIAVGFISRSASLSDFIYDLKNLNPRQKGFRPKVIDLIMRPGRLFHVIVPVGGRISLKASKP